MTQQSTLARPSLNTLNPSQRDPVRRTMVFARNPPKDVRAAFGWRNGDVSSARSLATRAVILRIPVPTSIQKYAARVLGRGMKPLYAIDSATTVKNNPYVPAATPTAEEIQVIEEGFAAIESLAGASVDGISIQACREQCFHHDDVRSEQGAYIAWAIGQTNPLEFHTMGQKASISPGDMIVFDAVHPHALLRAGSDHYVKFSDNDHSHRFLFVIAGVRLTKSMREVLGIKIGRPPKAWKRDMRHVNYCDITGEYID